MSATVAALLMAVVCALLAALGPRVIARIPEPAPEPEAEPAAESAAVEGGTDRTSSPPPVPDKPLYADLASRSGLGVGFAVAGAVVGGLTGAAIGGDVSLLPWALLTPVLIWLAWIDWHTRLLPTKLIAPTYGVLVVAILVAGLLDRLMHDDWGHLVGAGIGWAALGGLYVVLWLIYPRGLGYGDVRLSGLLGLALGFVGWTPVLVGGYAGFLLGAFGGIALKVLGRLEGRHYPFGPFMAAGAFVGVWACALWGLGS